MFTCFIKRVLPFIMTLIFGIGLGSIFGGSSQRTAFAPSFSAPQQTYRGCASKHRNLDNSTPSQNRQSSERQTRTGPVQVSQ
ncbi:MAG TPA: hypothetical protein VF708_07710 [Pyrinomonadaceae bacterium]|jgi:hypothetical protein